MTPNRSCAFVQAVLAIALAGAAAGAPPQLAVVNLKFHQYEGGPPVLEDFLISTGDTVFLSFNIQGFQRSEDQKIDLHCRIDAQDPDGVPVAEPVVREIKTELSPQDKDWMPLVRHSFAIPPLAFAGTYRIAAAVEDKLAARGAKSEMRFKVRGRNVEPSETVVTRNFRFLRTEEDRDPLSPAVYHPGDALWARFEITGFKYRANNEVNVEYGISVIGPAGNTMFSQPQAAVERDESFYPKKYLPGALSLNLDKKVLPGAYAIVVALRDNIGNQAQESRHEFRVE